MRQLGCVSQDAEPPASSSILRNGTKVLGPVRRVQFSKGTQRHANIRENKGPSLGKIQVKLPHQRSPCAMKFENTSQEETERQERGARGDAWRLAKNILKLKKERQSYILFASDEWVFRAASTIKLEEREFFVDSGASMHMLSRKDVNSAELETVKVFKNPATVATANGEVQTKEEATVYVKEFDLFVTVMLLEDAPAVLSLESRIKWNTANYVPIVVPGLSSSSATPTSPTSLPQKAIILTRHPASTSESASDGVRGDPSRGPAETENPNKTYQRTSMGRPVA